MKALAVAAGLLIAAPCVAPAQQLGPAPLLKDISSMETLPSDGTFDTNGLALGMKPAEFEAALKALVPPGKIQVVEGDYDIKDSRGNAAGFNLLEAIMFESGDDGKSRESIEATFATGHGGGRVVGLRRILSYATEAEMPYTLPLLEDLARKYGPASYEYSQGNRSMLFWVWFRGKRVAFPEGDPRRQQSPSLSGDAGAPEACLETIGMSWRYEYRPGRENPAPGCTAVIRVEINTSPGKDLTQYIAIRLLNVKAAVESAFVADKWLVEELTRKAGAQAPRPGPKL